MHLTRWFLAVRPIDRHNPYLKYVLTANKQDFQMTNTGPMK